jgi:hypothetical protein
MWEITFAITELAPSKSVGCIVNIVVDKEVILG